jgi:putative membrane protein
MRTKPAGMVRRRIIQDCQMAALFAFVHHIAAFTLFAAIVTELLLVRDRLTLVSARRLQLTDIVLGISAGALLVVGLLRVFYFEKGAYYYFHSWAFSVKFGLFIVVALISIIPTIEFLSWRKAISSGQVPALSDEKRRRLSAILHWELIGLSVIILCAVLMARGIGMMG